MEYRRVLYAEACYGDEEIEAVIDVLRTQRHSLVAGKNVEKFEQCVAEIFGKKYGLMVNSGSSANLIALQSMKLRLGGEVITPALTFSTTVSPILQSNLIPVFVDSDAETLQSSIPEVEASITHKTVAIMVPNLIGNIPDWEKLGDIAERHGIALIEDSCDAIGYKYNGSYGNCYSHMTTTSFYASHIITGAGVGGMVCFNDEDKYLRGKSLRSWGRRSSQYGETEDVERRLSGSIDGFNYDDKYIFDDIGYNFIPTEISAAFALEQFYKLDANIEKRKRNFGYLKKYFSKHSDRFTTYNTLPGVDNNWLAFPICLSGDLEGKRKILQLYMEKNGIQTRTIFTGNIMRHPLMDSICYKIADSNFCIADKIMRNGLLVGCHNSLDQDDLDYMTFHFDKFLESIE